MKTIPVSGHRGNGMSVLVSDEDFDFLSQWRWRLDKDGYAFRRTSSSGVMYEVRLHRIVAERAGLNVTGKEIDHRFGNKLDNQRDSLRAATTQQNQANRGAQRNNKLGVKGVHLCARCKKFIAQIKVSGRKITIGRYGSAAEASAAYAAAAMKHFGEFANAG